MKVNTDGVLLGALMSIRASDKRLLDVGTGTGTVALMAAQRLSDMILEKSGTEACTSFDIMAIDIDEPSASEASDNFVRSPWASCLNAGNVSFDDFAGSLPADHRYDLVFSNPPYFESSLRAPDERRRNARHSETLSYRDLVDFSAEYLNDRGRLSVILPSDMEVDLMRYARMNGLFAFRTVRISTVPGRTPRRIVAEFSRERKDRPAEESLTIQEKGRYTVQYTDLTSPFYLSLSRP